VGPELSGAASVADDAEEGQGRRRLMEKSKAPVRPVDYETASAASHPRRISLVNLGSIHALFAIAQSVLLGLAVATHASRHAMIK
jgi:hypothetical protein